MNTTCEVKYDNPDAVQIVSNAIFGLLCEYNNSKHAIACIGTDKVVFDSVGPIVGTFLTEMDIGVPVVGTLEYPMHNLNIKNRTDKLYKEYGDRCIIAIDAVVIENRLNFEEKFGVISVTPKPIIPGRGAGSTDNKPIGDISIKVQTVYAAEVDRNGPIRLHYIIEICKVISKSIEIALGTYYNYLNSEEDNDEALYH